MIGFKLHVVYVGTLAGFGGKLKSKHQVLTLWRERSEKLLSTSSVYII